MARIAGVDLPKNKRVETALTYIYGIGNYFSRRVLDEAEVDCATRVKDLTEAEVSRISTILARDYKVEGDLRREVQQHIRRFIEIGSYRGLRHRRMMPARGQRTKTNARTRRGKRKTVGSSRSVEKAQGK